MSEQSALIQTRRACGTYRVFYLFYFVVNERSFQCVSTQAVDGRSVATNKYMFPGHRTQKYPVDNSTNAPFGVSMGILGVLKNYTLYMERSTSPT